MRIFLMAMTALTLIGALPSSSAADENSAVQIFPACKKYLDPNDNADLFFQGLCIGKISGVAWASEFVCVPNEVTHGEMVRVVIAYIETRQNRLQESFNLLAREALSAPWPCKKG